MESILGDINAIIQTSPWLAPLAGVDRWSPDRFESLCSGHDPPDHGFRGGLAGGLFANYELGLRKRQPTFWVVFLFFAVPTCCFLIDPKVTQIQPLAIKRFVPMVFPLFFLLSLSGCSAFLAYPFKNYWYLQKVGFVTLVSLIGVTFFHNSAFLLEQPILANIIAQIHRMAEKIPSTALVVLSDSNAGWHLQMPLQYMVGLDTLLLPLGDLPDKKVSQVMVDYLRRQLTEGRPVFVILNSTGPPAAGVSRQFALAFKFEGQLSSFSVSGPGTTTPKGAGRRATTSSFSATTCCR